MLALISVSLAKILTYRFEWQGNIVQTFVSALTTALKKNRLPSISRSAGSGYSTSLNY